MKTYKKNIFAVPYNGESDLINHIVEDGIADTVFEFYGTDGSFASGRSNILSKHFTRDINLLQGRGIEFNFLLNALTPEDYIIKIKTLEDKLYQLNDLKVETLTLSHPILLNLIDFSKFNFKINSSVNQFVNSIDRALLLKSLGYSRITIDEDELRNLRLISNIFSACEIPIEIIINNCCLNRCPNRLTHQAILSSVHPKLSDHEKSRIESIIHKNCRNIFKSNVIFFLKANWIRPEDIKRYLDIGVSIFKLSGRTFSTNAIIQCLKIYSTRNYSGNVIDYLKPERNCSARYGFTEIKSSLVEKFFKHIWDNCTGDNCEECLYLAKNVEFKMLKKNL